MPKSPEQFSEQENEPVGTLDLNNPDHIELWRRFTKGELTAEEAGPVFSGNPNNSPTIDLTIESFDQLAGKIADNTVVE